MPGSTGGNNNSSPSAAEGNSGKTLGSTGKGQDEQSLSMAVELAAVNQAIIALSGQTPINVTPENDRNGENGNENGDQEQTKATEAEPTKTTASSMANSQPVTA